MPGGGLQPHRRGSPLRTPGQALDAMLRGGDAQGNNPADQQRMAQEKRAAGGVVPPRAGQARKSRPSRPARPAR